MKINKILFFGLLLYTVTFLIWLLDIFIFQFVGITKWLVAWLGYMGMAFVLSKWYFLSEEGGFKQGFLFGNAILVVAILADMIITVVLLKEMGYEQFYYYNQWEMLIAVILIWIFSGLGAHKNIR